MHYLLEASARFAKYTTPPTYLIVDGLLVTAVRRLTPTHKELTVRLQADYALPTQ
jgi:hypothetical protein